VSSLLDIGDNPIVSWSMLRSRRDSRGLAVAIIYLLVVHGVMLMGLAFTTVPGGIRFRELTAFAHFITWGANAFLFLLVVPTRHAQVIGTEREKKTLDFLRLTRLSSRRICMGSFVSAYMLPVLLALTSIPEILVGCFSEEAGYVTGVVQAYFALGASSLLATSIGGLIAFLPKKGNQAASTAFMVVVLLVAAGGLWSTPFAEVFGCLGPWGGLLSSAAHVHMRYLVKVAGADVPGVLLQVPLAALATSIFLRATTRKIHEERPGILGLSNATALALLIAAVSGATYSTERSSYWYGAQPDPGPLIAGRMIIVLLALLPVAADGAVSREDVIRGLARAPRPPERDERLSIFGPIAAILLVLALHGAALVSAVEPRHQVCVVIATAGAASALVVVHLIFQAARLFFSEVARNVMAIVGIAGLWFLPLLAFWGTSALDLPSWVRSLPSMLCPFVATTQASMARDRWPLPAGEVDPIALALVGVLFNVLAAVGLFAVTRELGGRLRDFAATLAVLPADVFAPAGRLGKKCDNGHQFSEVWDSCPHCVR
jgi:hypothetical protein